MRLNINEDLKDEVLRIKEDNAQELASKPIKLATQIKTTVMVVPRIKSYSLWRLAIQKELKIKEKNLQLNLDI